MTDSLSPTLLTSLIFGAVLLASVLVKLWLASRQARAVAAHRGAVPAQFASVIGLPAHQRAADYTLVKLRLGMLETALAAAILLGVALAACRAA